MINSRDINDLRPCVRDMAQKFIEQCAGIGIDVLITSTFRDAESQDAIYAQGRTSPGKKVTNAKGGQSFHNFQVAFDFVPLVGGKAAWDCPHLFEQCGEIAEGLGLEWGGRWNHPDMPHCQYTGGLSLADFRNGAEL